MKTKQTIITTGAYDSYRIVCTVEGAQSPAVSTLWKEFVTDYGVWDKPTKSAMDIMNKVNDNSLARYLLTNAGYKGDNLGEQFVAWLIREHGYKRVKLMGFHVG